MQEKESWDNLGIYLPPLRPTLSMHGGTNPQLLAVYSVLHIIQILLIHIFAYFKVFLKSQIHNDCIDFT